MPVVLRLKRSGARKRPFYRIVAADSRRQRDGRFLEILGYYDPIAKTSTLKVDEDKVKRWLSHGAQPSEQVASLLRKVGMKPQPSAHAKRPEATAADAAAPAPKARKKTAAKKKAARRVPRKKSARKVEKLAARKKGAPKKAAKKSAKK
ncbi:MAG: 30S ribosomal protein S16 [Candidatus Eisenbacteria bacterium]|uniref:Small ribosomal subunit protein bS16 n=1 Tax=Eiseniibacteriota bacterium TaxID=2212470 RepID=A0A849SKJ0_UNCEI|nr:30S ribosomal protein S16 [Candidatus Eisenbacteria bacterium]